MVQPLINGRLFANAHNIFLIEPPNNLFVGFNAAVIGEPLGPNSPPARSATSLRCAALRPGDLCRRHRPLESGAYAAVPNPATPQRVAESVALRS